MPSLFIVFGYKLYFCADESDEPVHVHISKGRSSSKATKIWLTSTGGVLTVNSSRHPRRDINKLEEFVLANYYRIIEEWESAFGSVMLY